MKKIASQRVAVAVLSFYIVVRKRLLLLLPVKNLEVHNYVSCNPF